MRFSTRVALVTGAASGIGRATALTLAREGACVSLLDVREREVHEVASCIRDFGGRAMSHQCDVASEGHVDNVIKATVSEFGTVDILVVNAGITAEGLLHEFTLADWNYVLSINLTGAFISIKTVLPYMISKGKGCIVGVSSISADLIAVGRGSAVYEVSKAGLSQLLRAVAVEYADRGIRANTVCPGRVSTQLGEHRRELEATHFASRPTEFRRIFKSSPANRSADPTEIAKAIAFLASDDASFITGADLRIDGGYSLV